MATTSTSYEELLKENEELKAQIETTQQSQTQYQQSTAPTKYVSPYAAELEKLAGELKGSSFKYSKKEDPNWQSMRKQYILAADRTEKDVLAQASAPTGGRASSYAITAASQAANDMRASLTEQEQALYDAAFDRYYQDYSKKLQDYANLLEQDNTNYDRWLQEETQAQELKDQNYERLVTLIASTGHSPSEEELAAAGMSAGEAASWKSYYQQQLALSSGSGGGSGGYSSGYSSGSSGSSSSGSSGTSSSSGNTGPVSSSLTSNTVNTVVGAGIGAGTAGIQGVDYDYLASQGNKNTSSGASNTSTSNKTSSSSSSSTSNKQTQAGSSSTSSGNKGTTLSDSKMASTISNYKTQIKNTYGSGLTTAQMNAYLKNKILYSSYSSAQKTQLLKYAGFM